jgi:hypothetical protein
MPFPCGFGVVAGYSALYTSRTIGYHIVRKALVSPL